jgi:cytochrome P450
MGGAGYLAISRAAAEVVLKNPRLFPSTLAVGSAGNQLRLIPASFDPPEHTRYRRILRPFFSPHAVAGFQLPVRGLVNKLLDTLVARGECDFASDFAIPLSAEAFMCFFGLPLADRDRVIGWKDGLKTVERPQEDDSTAMPDVERSEKARDGLYAYLADQIELRKSRGIADDMLGWLVHDGERLTDRELMGMSVQFVLAGLDTVSAAISTAFSILATRSDLRKRLVEHPEMSARAAEEFLRFSGISPVIPRVTTGQVELCGQVIQAGSRVQVMLGAANRDPRAHTAADTIDFSREERNVAFGAGPHRCLGMHLARMELRTVLEEWHRRIPDYTLAPSQPTWSPMRLGISGLPLAFPPGGRSLVPRDAGSDGHGGGQGPAAGSDRPSGAALAAAPERVLAFRGNRKPVLLPVRAAKSRPV